MNNNDNMQNSPVAKLKEALNQLYESSISVDKAFSDFEAQDLPQENKNLRESVKALTEKLQNTEQTLFDLKNDHNILETNFKDELRQKRAALFNSNEKQMQNYLSMRLENETAQLNHFRFQFNQKLEHMSAELKILEDNDRQELQAEINNLSEKVKIYTDAAQRRINYAWNELLADKAKAMENMKAAEIQNNALRAVRNFFNWETFFGLRLISSLGILLIIIGVFTFGRYVYIQMGNQMQCACIFGIGLVFLVAGEILNKKWRGIFSRAITAGGSGILFLATALGYLTLEVLSMQTALGICAGISIISFLLAIRHNSQTISIFALIGGYLPIFALEKYSEIIILWAVIYFTILNLFSLALSTRKNWQAARFIGLFAGIYAEVRLIFFTGLIGALGRVGAISFHTISIIVISSVAIAYIAYLIIPVFGALFTKTKIKSADIVLLVCNIFFRFLIGLFAIYTFNFDRYDALVPAFFTLTCICMALLAERGAHESVPEKDKGSLRALFFVTSVTFAALVVLFWFDRVWFSSGWLIEGAGLFLYGVLKSRKRFTVAGSIIGSSCVWIFLFINVPDYNNNLFVWQYLLLTLGLLTAAIVLAAKKIPQRYPAVQIFQAGAVFNVWIFVIYLLYNPVYDYLWEAIYVPINIIYLSCIIFGILFSYILPRIRAFYCNGIHIASIIIGVLSVIWLFSFNAISGNILRESSEITIKVLVMSLYIISNLLGVFWMRDLLQFLVLKKALPLIFYPLLLSGYFVILLMQNLVVQLNLQASSMVLTFIFGGTALCWIIFGFARRNNVTRISGLSLSFFAVIKLFVLDLFDLSTELKIVSYFTMGILLLAISFIYQYFNKKLKNSENPDII